MPPSLLAVHAQCPWFFTATFAVLGAVIGSFLNVCIYRVPKGESVVRPGSHCACGAAIPWYRNIPVLAWFFQRGRAACCGRHFSFRYPLVEALTGALFALCWQWLPWQQALPGMVLVAFLVALAFMDLDTMLLPDAPNAALALAGLALSCALPGLHGFAAVDGGAPWLADALRSVGVSLGGMFVGAGLVYWVRFLASTLAGREAMGEGDVILAGGIGAFCGWQGAVFSLLGGAVAGSVVLLPLLLAKKIFHNGGEPEGRARSASLASCEGDEAAEENYVGGAGVSGEEVPFGPWLAVGAVAWFLYFRAPTAHLLDDFLTALATPLAR
jgi:leader peptidase (prepilin peptidase)/N-methyltransferase